MRTSRKVLLASLFPVLAGGLVAQEAPPPEPRRDVQTDLEREGITERAPKPAAVKRMRTGGGNEWWDRTRLQMGDHLNKEVIKGAFKFKNPHDRTIQFSSFTGSCQCARAVIRIGGRTYTLSKTPTNPNTLHRLDIENGAEVKVVVSRINVEPGQAGEVEVHMEMAGIQGIKEASVQFATTDKKHRLMILKWEGMGVKLFNIRPSDFFLNDLKWEDEKVFRFQISSSVKKDFKLLDHEPLPAYVKIKKKQIKLPDGTPAWEVSGTFGPKADPGAGGAAIKFKTDLQDKTLSLNVVANVLGPVSIQPGTFMPFGRIKNAVGAERKVVISPNGDFDLQVQKIEFRKLKIDRKFLEVHYEKHGKDIVVRLKVLPGAARKKRMTLVRGVMVVHLNHPAVKSKDFSFNGILR